MFERLIESQPRKERGFWQTCCSAGVHFALIVLAVQVTQGRAETADPVRLATPAFVRVPAPPRPAPVHAVVRPTASASPSLQTFAVNLPMAPHNIPLSLPTVDLSAGSITPRHYEAGVVTGGNPLGTPGGTDLMARLSQEAFSSDDVDTPAEFDRWTEPKYPTALRVAGVTGQVTLEFVVGIDGRAEATSIRVLTSTNSRFEESAVEAVRSATYRPARIGRQAVRQLVVQRVNFTLDPF